MLETNVWSIVVAAGSGTRFGADKQLQPLHGRRVIDWSVNMLCDIGPTVVVGPASSDPAQYFASTEDPSKTIMSRVERFVRGGDSRSESVRCGLACVDETATHVLIHDAARPVLGPLLLERIIDALADGADGVVPVVPVVDTLQTLDGRTVDRSELVAVQTPQGFKRGVLQTAHEAGLDATDDSTLVHNIGGRVVHVDGDPRNVKVTVPDDMRIVEAFIREPGVSGSAI